ncbi:hypothetical protein TCAL_04934 [Tigriopus californicus]|uniref:Glutathione peroxidase n=1 Tax=Tigriopus californicus TaxID=6832 RepID=A0A553NED4_TIGCA|nr:hypothetical protein TCAL_04934 [Tigriopus californicus]
MAWFFTAALSLLALSHVSETKLSQTESIKFELCTPNDDERIYKPEYFAEDIERTSNISLADYTGKYGKNSDFRVLAFPCNQFGKQEPGANATEILNGMKYVRPGLQQGYPYEAKFPLTWKVDVNGDDNHPLFDHLTNVCPPPWKQFWPKESLWWSPLNAKDIKWNFEKFLIRKNGLPYKRYHSNTDPLQLIPDIDELLEESYEEESVTTETNLFPTNSF